jgi:hypothetical protein
MAYAIIQFIEGGERRATLCRTENGQPTGADGVMDALSAFIEHTSPQLLREGSPGALYMAQLFVKREQDAGHPIRVVGGDGELGISAEEVKALAGQGYFYEVRFGRDGEREMPSILQHPIPR